MKNNCWDKILTIGSDPEFALINQDGKPISGVGLIGGTKKNGVPISAKTEGCLKEEDNVGCEFTVPPVDFKDATSALKLRNYITDCVYYTNLDLQDKGLRLANVSSLEYDAEQLDSESAQRFGCEASYDIYTGTVSERPTPTQVGSLRSFGFHIHLGLASADVEMSPRERGERSDKIIFLCDLFMGLPSIILDEDEKRRKIYGNLGDHRFTSYGLEYRTLGGYMFKHIKFIGLMLERINNILADESQVNHYFNAYFERVKALTQNLNKDEVMSIINELNIFLPKKMFVYGTLKTGHGNNRLLTNADFLGEGSTVRKYGLYSVGFPFMTDKESFTNVHGEVFAVNSQKELDRVDSLEGHPNWYVRKPCIVQLDDNLVLETETYINNSPSGSKLANGRF